MKKSFYALVAAVLIVLANVTSVFACAWWSYQPKTPKSLQR